MDSVLQLGSLAPLTSEADMRALKVRSTAGLL